MDFVLGAYHLNDNFERYLDNFTQKFGYGDPDAHACILFQGDVDAYIQLYELPKFLDEDQVYVSEGFDIESYAYLDFQTFYDYLEPVVMRHYVTSGNKVLLEHLAACRQVFGLPTDSHSKKLLTATSKNRPSFYHCLLEKLSRWRKRP